LNVLLLGRSNENPTVQKRDISTTRQFNKTTNLSIEDVFGPAIGASGHLEKC
jgi:hypothetical protein